MDVFLIKKFYENLDRGEKGKFLLWLQATLEISQTTAITRINTDGWRNVERPDFGNESPKIVFEVKHLLY